MTTAWMVLDHTLNQISDVFAAGSLRGAYEEDTQGGINSHDHQKVVTRGWTAVTPSPASQPKHRPCINEKEDGAEEDQGAG